MPFLWWSCHKFIYTLNLWGTTARNMAKNFRERNERKKANIMDGNGSGFFHETCFLAWFFIRRHETMISSFLIWPFYRQNFRGRMSKNLQKSLDRKCLEWKKKFNVASGNNLKYCIRFAFPAGFITCLIVSLMARSKILFRVW